MADFHKSSRRPAVVVGQCVALMLIRGYRLLLSPLLTTLLGPACRFQPTCSEYASDAIAGYGVARGSALALRRLLRCRPLGGRGYDPVPTDHRNAHHNLPSAQ